MSFGSIMGGNLVHLRAEATNAEFLMPSSEICLESWGWMFFFVL